MHNQIKLPLPIEQAAPARVRIRVTWSDNQHTKLQAWFNGDLITGDGFICIRNRDIVYLLLLLKPEVVILDRENIADDLWKRIRHFPAVELI